MISTMKDPAHILRNSMLVGSIALVAGAAVAATQLTSNTTIAARVTHVATSTSVTTTEQSALASSTAAGPCTPKDIAWSSGPFYAASHMSVAVYVLTNVGTVACSIMGVGQGSMTDSSGHQYVDLRASDTPPTLVTLRPKGEASFYLAQVGCGTYDFSYGKEPTVFTVSIPGTGISRVFHGPSGPSCATIAIQPSPVVAGIISVPGFTTGGSPPNTGPFANPGPGKSTATSAAG